MSSNNPTQALPEASPYARHIPALDGVRGFAALGVVLSHVFPGTPRTHPEIVLRHVLSFGALGVDLFFVLSGFLITGILYDSLADSAFFRKFYARRALRIFPLYYGVLIAFAIAAIVFHLNFHHQLLSLALYLQNTYRIAIPISLYTGPSILPLGHFWSLAIEEQFYLVWPVVVFLVRKKRSLFFCCAAALLLCPLLRADAYVHGFPYGFIHVNTLCRSDSLLAGAALALLLRSKFHGNVLRTGMPLFCIGFAGIFLPDVFIPHLHSAFLANLAASLRYSAAAAAASGVLLLALGSPFIRRLFTLGTLRSLGKYSYGIYVLHIILFAYFERPIRSFMLAHVTTSKAAIILTDGVLCFALTLLAAYLSYNFYERRFLRLKRFFDYRRHATSAT